MRKVYVDVTIRLIMNVEDGVSIGDVMGEMDYEFNPLDETAEVVDTEMVNIREYVSWQDENGYYEPRSTK